jgi:hypothetical protein
VDELKDFGDWLDERPTESNGYRSTRKRKSPDTVQKLVHRIKRNRRRMCTGKRAFDDPFEAVREMIRMPYRKPDVSKYSLSLYECYHCHYWHIGTVLVDLVQLTELSDVPKIQGQGMLKFPELKDYGTYGERIKTRDGEPA